jgi:hypothetical protein
MKFALLGSDPDVLALAVAAKAEGHEIVWLGDVRPSDSMVVRNSVSRGVTPRADWESLLDRGVADAVLVGRGEADDNIRSEQLKRLVAADVPLLVVHPALLSVLTYYELDMVGREVGSVLRHYNPAMGHPSLDGLSQAVRDQHETIGRVLQIACTRYVATDSREAVLEGLARDAELLAQLAGDIQRVSAVGPKGDSASFGSLQVQLEAAGPATVRWSAAPKGRSAERVVVSLIGERGTIEWTQSATASNGYSEAEYSLQLADETSTEIPYDSATDAIRGLAAAVENRTATAAWQDQPPGHSTWSAATRAMEVVDAVELSLQKGRTVEVHQQKLTEQLAFRGTMAAFGCGLMLLVTLAAVVVGIVGGVESLLEKRLIQGWAAAILVVLAGFLALQVVPFLSKKRQPSAPHDGD